MPCSRTSSWRNILPEDCNYFFRQYIINQSIYRTSIPWPGQRNPHMDTASKLRTIPINTDILKWNEPQVKPIIRRTVGDYPSLSPAIIELYNNSFEYDSQELCHFDRREKSFLQPSLKSRHCGFMVMVRLFFFSRMSGYRRSSCVLA